MPMTKPNYSQAPTPVVIVHDATNPYPTPGGGGGGGGGGGSSDTTEATQLLVLAELENLDADVGALTDAAAPADGTGNYSIISAFKRALLNGAALLARIPTLHTGTPAPNDPATPVRQAPEEIFTAGFSAVGAGVMDQNFTTPIVGTGVTFNQAAGALNILSGTTANAEFLSRSIEAFKGTMRMRFSALLSQRIVNNNFAVLLADLVGEGLAYNIVNSTTLDVTVPAHGFTSQMVGQSILAGGFTGAAAIPGRYAIASIPDVNTIRFTVAGFPASGTGTCTLFGRNYVRNLFTGTTATTTNFDTQRNGWAIGDTAATTLTSASPGLMVVNDLTGRDVFLLDSLRASATAPALVSRASRVENIPDQFVPLYAFIWAFNGTTAPASTTTFTMGHLAVEPYLNNPVEIANIRARGSVHGLPVNLLGGTTTVTVATAGINVAPTPPLTPLIINSAASTNGQLVLTGTSGLQALFATNTGATVAFVKLYNKATAPTVGTDVPAMIITVPAAVGGVPGTAQISPGFSGYRFALGLGLAITGLVADTDTTAVAAGQVKVILSRTV